MDITSNTVIPPIQSDNVKQLMESKDHTSKNMYTNGYLVSVRVCNTDKSETFFRGKCRAEMKKKIAYFVDIQVTCFDSGKGDQKDKICVVEAAQCECPAGVGPEPLSKYICFVLLALQSDTASESMCLEKFCTSKLQNFHKPSATYDDSP